MGTFIINVLNRGIKLQNPESLNLSATRLVASAVGVLAGVLGVEHGLFEMLQVMLQLAA